MIRPLCYYGNPILRKKAKPVTAITDDILSLADDLFDTMEDQKGLGLAAPQIGVSQQVIAVLSDDDARTPKILINPILSEAVGKLSLEEGCLSFPGIYGKIERAEEITVNFLDLSGSKKCLRVQGMFCRALLHEFDHLTGTLFIDRMNPTHKIVIQGQLKKLLKQTKKDL